MINIELEPINQETIQRFAGTPLTAFGIDLKMNFDGLIPLGYFKNGGAGEFLIAAEANQTSSLLVINCLQSHKPIEQIVALFQKANKQLPIQIITSNASKFTNAKNFAYSPFEGESFPRYMNTLADRAIGLGKPLPPSLIVIDDIFGMYDNHRVNENAKKRAQQVFLSILSISHSQKNVGPTIIIANHTSSDVAATQRLLTLANRHVPIFEQSQENEYDILLNRRNIAISTK